MRIKTKLNTKLLPRGRASLFLLVFLLSSITALPIFQTPQVGAVVVDGGGGGPTIINTMSQYDQIKSDLYLNAMMNCFKNAALSDGDFIQASDVESGKWFHEREWVSGATSEELLAVGVYMIGTPGVIAEDARTGFRGEMGEVSCSNADFIMSALTLWGFQPDEAIQVLCGAGFARDKVDDWDDLEPTEKLNKCLNGTTKLSRSNGGNKDKSADAFRAYILNSVYGAVEPTFSPIQWYEFYRGTLAKSCIPDIATTAPSTTMDISGNDKGYSGVQWVDLTTDPANPKVITGSYIGEKKPGDKVFVNSSYDGYDYKLSCQAIIDEMNTKGYAQAFADWAKLHPDEAAELFNDSIIIPIEPGAEDTMSCGANVAGIGWMLCPMLTAINGLNDLMWKLVSSLLTTNPLTQSDTAGGDSTIYKAWSAIRDLANVAFVIFFLIITYSQLTGGGFTNYGIKKLLPKIIVAAILVNTSFVIVQIAVDLANIIGNSLYSFLLGLVGGGVHFESDSMMKSIGLVAGGATVGGIAIVAAGGLGALFFLIIPFILIAALGLLTAMLTLVFRQAMIPVLAIIAPLAFVAYMLPNTESWFKKWRSMFMSMLMMFPIAAVVFGGAQIAGGIIINQGGFWNMLIGLTVMTLPLFSLPFIARQGGTMLTKVGGALGKIKDKARAPLSTWGKNLSESSKSKYLADDPRTRRDGVTPRRLRRITPFGRLQSAAIANSGRKRVREMSVEKNQEILKSRILNDQVRGITGRTVHGRDAAVRLETAKRQSGADTKNISAEGLHRNIGGINEREHLAENLLTEEQGLNKQRLHDNHSLDASRVGAENATNRAAAATDRFKGRVAPLLKQSVTEAETGKKYAEAETAKVMTEIKDEGHLDVAETSLRDATSLGKAADDKLTTRITPNLRDSTAAAEEAKIDLDTAQTQQKTDIEPELYEAKQANAGAKDELTGMENWTQADIDAAASGLSETELRAAGSRAAGLTQAQRDAARDAKYGTKVAEGAKTSAARMIGRDIANRMSTPRRVRIPDPTVPGGFRLDPTSPDGFAYADAESIGAGTAGYIDPDGAVHATARSVGAESALDRQDVDVHHILFQDRNTTNSELRDGLTSGRYASDSQQQAAIERIYRTGAVEDVYATLNWIGHQPPTRRAELETVFLDELNKKNKFQSIGGIAKGGFMAGTIGPTGASGCANPDALGAHGADVGTYLAYDRVTSGKFGPVELFDADPQEVERFATMFSHLTGTSDQYPDATLVSIDTAITQALTDPASVGNRRPTPEQIRRLTELQAQVHAGRAAISTVLGNPAYPVPPRRNP